MKYLYSSICTLLIALFAFTANAQVCTATTAGDWTNNAIWSCGVAPSGTFSGTIIIENNVTVSSAVTISGLVTIIVTNSATLNIQGSNVLLLSNNASKINVTTGSTVSGQSNNSNVIIGTAPDQTSYKLNGASTVSGPIVLTNGGQTLPVTLLTFNVASQGKRISIAWATANEQEADHFVVEKSRNLAEFMTVGTVLARGTTNVRQNYGLIDEQPLPGTNYYRLKQVDLSGAVTYTKAVSVNVNMAEPGLLVMGNPIRTGTIKLTTQNLTDASFQLMSLSGQTVAIRTDAQANGDVTLTPVSPPATGLYLLTVKSGATNLVRKILID